MAPVSPFPAHRPALLWESSPLWGWMALEALRNLSIPCPVLSADGCRRGALDPFDLLIVPGGWARGKARALGPEGLEAMAAFIARGGAYVGFCGGAGLILQRPDLFPLGVSRVTGPGRLPNFSGPMVVQWSQGAHILCQGLGERAELPVWWPSQLHLDDASPARVVARYVGPGRGFAVADLDLLDTVQCGLPWSAWEDLYGIALDPQRLVNEPAVVTASLGRGSLLLSMLHLDDPTYPEGQRALANLLAADASSVPPPPSAGATTAPLQQRLARLFRKARTFIARGERALLWAWRTPWLLRWRRGVRGFELGSLHVALRELHRHLPPRLSPRRLRAAEPHLRAVEDALPAFLDRAWRLVLEERCVSPQHLLPPEHQQRLRRRQGELFASPGSYGGAYQHIMDDLERLTLLVLGR